MLGAAGVISGEGARFLPAAPGLLALVRIRRCVSAASALAIPLIPAHEE